MNESLKLLVFAKISAWNCLADLSRSVTVESRISGSK